MAAQIFRNKAPNKYYAMGLKITDYYQQKLEGCTVPNTITFHFTYTYTYPEGYVGVYSLTKLSTNIL